MNDELAPTAPNAEREDEIARLRAELIHAHNWQKRMCQLHAEDLANMSAQRDKLAAFKAYVHRRLDEAGVPADPPGEHREAGCRIGQRLDWLMVRP